MDTKIVYSLGDLKKLGVKIFMSELNRVIDIDLVEKFSSDLVSGGELYTPGTLVDAKECLKSGRRLVRDNGKIISSISDLSEKEKQQLEYGQLAVVFDGNHRYRAALRALDYSTDENIKSRILKNIKFVFKDIPSSELNSAFIKMNTERNTIDNTDFIPYIISNFGTEGDYRFDKAMFSCQKAKSTGHKSCLGQFNYIGAALVCSGGRVPRAYKSKEGLKVIAIHGKSDLLDKRAKTGDYFDKFIIIPYIFEKNLGLDAPLVYKDLIFKNKLRLLERILNIPINGDPIWQDLYDNVEYISVFAESILNKSFLEEYKNIRTIRKSSSSCPISSNEQRSQIIYNTFENFIQENSKDDIINRYQILKTSFNDELENLKLKEKNLLKHLEVSGNKGAYVTNHNSLIKSQKLSVVAKYLYGL